MSRCATCTATHPCILIANSTLIHPPHPPLTMSCPPYTPERPPTPPARSPPPPLPTGRRSVEAHLRGPPLNETTTTTNAGTDNLCDFRCEGRATAQWPPNKQFFGGHHAKLKRPSATVPLRTREDMCKTGVGAGSSAGADQEPNGRQSNHEWTDDQA